ncbi:E3 SUMO-protein ligase NSE2-like [Eurosta solidaginis]|uniref:E3 SUMO-protein ligase NSE2-like n=1 Tax=Eurosta solidaginis TaxID=178769 RepID=UPI0035316023
MSDLLRAELENAQLCLLETYELAASYGDNEDKDMDKFLNLMERLCQIRDDGLRNENALAVAMEERSVADFVAMFQRELAKGNSKKCQPKKTREYKAFHDRLNEIANSGETSTSGGGGNGGRTSTDGIEMEIHVNLDDPLTKRRMVDPVKNTLCGHVYEKSSIRDAIQINPRLRCPVAGCGNNQYISEAHLKPDNALKLHLQRIADAQENE